MIESYTLEDGGRTLEENNHKDAEDLRYDI
jgi:hypothetical protein